jgi:hypothetical protein
VFAAGVVMSKPGAGVEEVVALGGDGASALESTAEQSGSSEK